MKIALTGVTFSPEAAVVWHVSIMPFNKAVLTWPGQYGTFVLKSSGGFKQRDGSPCTCFDMQF